MIICFRYNFHLKIVYEHATLLWRFNCLFLQTFCAISYHFLTWSRLLALVVSTCRSTFSSNEQLWITMEENCLMKTTILDLYVAFSLKILNNLFSVCIIKKCFWGIISCFIGTPVLNGRCSWVSFHSLHHNWRRSGCSQRKERLQST